MARLCPLFSGSKGNSTYIGSSGQGVLIDIGRSAKQIENAMRANDLELSSVKAIFVTHEHQDHIQGLRIIAARYGIKVFASHGTLKALEIAGALSDKVDYEMIGPNGVEVAGMYVKPFVTSHDSAESFGYVVKTCDDRQAAVATDLGFVSEDIKENISKCDIVMIESNHDIGMLQNGAYPYFLKRRILSDIGHLSNDACAKELPDLVCSGVTRFVLAHLSGENNMPEIAYQTAVCHLNEHGMNQGVDYDIFIAPKENLGQKTLVF